MIRSALNCKTEIYNIVSISLLFLCNRRLHGDSKLVKEDTGVDEEIINLRYSFLGRKERRHNARGPVRFRTKEIFLPSNCLCLSSVLIPFTPFEFFNRAPWHSSCARTQRDRPCSFQWHLVLPASESPPQTSRIPAKASFTVTVLETRNDQNNFFMRSPLEDAGLSFFGCLDLVLPGWHPPRLWSPVYPTQFE